MPAPTTRHQTAIAAIMRTAAVAVLAALAVVGVSAGPALADDGDAAWTVRTASNSFGADRSSFSYAVNPGGVVSDTMVVANRGTAPLTLAVYAADGYTTETGQLDLFTKDKKSIAIGAWVHADHDSVAIQPGQTTEVPFKVTVPTNATPGDYVGGILTSLTQADDTASVNVDRRLGIRIKLRVSGELKPNLAIEDFHVDYAGQANPFGKGDATVTYTIHNTGNAMLSAQQTVSVSGPFGWLRVQAGQIAAPPQLLPGESWTVTVPVHGVAPAVSLAATVTLVPLLTDVSGTTTSLKAVEVTTHGVAIPWTLLILVIIVVAALVGFLILNRRARAKRKLAEDARVQQAVQQALRDKDKPED